MTDPVDILAIAARARHDAEQAWRATMAMNNSPLAAETATRAWAAVMLADYDRETVFGLIRDLAK